VVFEDGGNVDNAKAFVGFLVGEGWLAHYLDFAGDRMLPAMPKLLQAPFWLDPGDPHRMRSAMQLLSRPRSLPLDLRHRNMAAQGDFWPEAVHRVVTEGISPEQAVDEAIARMKRF
jgi:multiple sugar transport system substrate-binding protein